MAKVLVIDIYDAKKLCAILVANEWERIKI